MDRLFALAEQATASSHADIPYSSQTVMTRRTCIGVCIAGLLTGPQAVANEGRTPTKGYPYSFSPLEFLAEQERQILPNESNEKAIRTALKIANTVADHAAAMTRLRLRETLQRQYDLYDPPPVSKQEALMHAGQRYDWLEKYVEDVGSAIHTAGYRYKPEELLSSAFSNSQTETPFHLDCDLLTYVTLHAAHEHDMPLAAVPAPHHMYIGSFRFRQFAMEMTNIGRSKLATTHAEQKNVSEDEGLHSRDPQDYRPCDEDYVKADIIRCLKTAAFKFKTYV